MSPPETRIIDPDAPAPEAGTPPFADAYMRHRAWLTALLARRFGAADADDIAQDTYLKVRDYRPPQPVRHPRSLLARIALNLAFNRFRKTAREVSVDPANPLLANAGAEDAAEQARFFEQMMLALPSKLSDVFVLSHVRGLTYREIAELRGISIKTVEKRMTQAIALCADMVRS